MSRHLQRQQHNNAPMHFHPCPSLAASLFETPFPIQMLQRQDYFNLLPTHSQNPSHPSPLPLALFQQQKRKSTTSLILADVCVPPRHFSHPSRSRTLSSRRKPRRKAIRTRDDRTKRRDSARDLISDDGCSDCAYACCLGKM